MFLLNEFYSVSMEGDIINVALFKEMDLSFVDMAEHLQCNIFLNFFFFFRMTEKESKRISNNFLN